MTTTAEPPVTGETLADPLQRQERLAGRVSRLRRRGGGNLDRWMLIGGGVLMPLGFLLVLLGWAGAAHTPLLFEQIPYLISGGLLGIGLVFAGGLVYFAYWQTLLVRESRTARQDLTATLERIEGLLAAGAGLQFAGAPSGPAANGESRYVATATGSMLHRPDCAVVVDRPNLRTVTADTPGLTACGLCDPLGSNS